MAQPNNINVSVILIRKLNNYLPNIAISIIKRRKKTVSLGRTSINDHQLIIFN